MRILSLTAAIILACSSATPAFSAGLSISGGNLVWNEGVDGSPSAYMEIEIFNDGVTDLLGAWALDLSLQQVSGTGTVEFNSASIAVLGSDYLMFGNSSGLGGTVTATSIYAYDFDPPGPPAGVLVPASGKYLLAVNFTTPDAARGVWNLVTTGGEANSYWSDDSFNELAFTNVPFGAGPVVIGTISVIPEPSSVVLAATAGVLMAGYAVRRRRSRKSA